MKIVYERLSSTSLNPFLKQLTYVFSTQEVMTKTLKVSPEELYDLFYPIAEKSLHHSYVVKDTSTHAIVGGIICNDLMFFLDELDYGDKIFSQELQGIITLLSELEKKYLAENSLSLKKGSHFYQYATFVNPDYQAQGIANKLYHLSEEDAKLFKFKKLVTISTGPISQHIRINKLNFKTTHEIDYASFSFQGKNIFSDIQLVPSCKFLVKSLTRKT